MSPSSQPAPLAAPSPPCVSVADDATRWFKEEVQPLEGNLRSFLHHQFPSLRDVDDVVQDSYLKLWRAKTAGTLKSMQGFLFTTARNAALDVFRRRATRGEIAISEADAGGVIIDEPDAAELTCRHQELDLLAQAIEALPLRCRQVLKLRKIYGLTHKEIADQLGMAERTVNVHLAKGVHRCAEYISVRGMKNPTANPFPPADAEA